jgi:enolase-phosphatase E1
MSEVRVYLLDVEGTASPISLVSEQLYPFARKHLAAFLQAHIEEVELHIAFDHLCEENRAERGRSLPMFVLPDEGETWTSVIPTAVAYLEWLMDRDRKSPVLKYLQGRIWEAGYLSGELEGTVFPDVADAFARWSKRAKVAIYSSGSVAAQQLVFGHSTAGDLRPLISGYFDLKTGAKTEAASYRAIAKAMEVEPAEMLFCSDAVRELNPAREAGCQTRLALRPGNPAVAETQGHAAIASFAEIP